MEFERKIRVEMAQGNCWCFTPTVIFAGQAA